MIKSRFLTKILGVALIMTATVACSEHEADFVGYIVSKDNEKITIVESSDREPPFVLLRSDSRFQVGSKVEVRFKDKVMDTMFPSTAEANISEVLVPAEEKRVLEKLLTFISDQNASNYYAAVLSIKEQRDDWIIETKEYDHDTGEVKLVNYSVSNNDLDVTTINSIRGSN